MPRPKQEELEKKEVEEGLGEEVVELDMVSEEGMELVDDNLIDQISPQENEAKEENDVAKEEAVKQHLGEQEKNEEQ